MQVGLNNLQLTAVKNKKISKCTSIHATAFISMSSEVLARFPSFSGIKTGLRGPGWSLVLNPLLSPNYHSSEKS